MRQKWRIYGSVPLLVMLACYTEIDRSFYRNRNIFGEQSEADGIEAYPESPATLVKQYLLVQKLTLRSEARLCWRRGTI